ncbi:unnamed protein product [Kuraishia capsulata CBS 1993]|uniref:Uncharacterized protein n=1 Tax=Kuraishia capsulata CBS 1993 TaxID=1382522 RepID=W6MN36_9ASCO|nr:uncharacterized protein KUCA_T00003976001 [Kuraishia capsulata CBS 1993]CDK27996.1 unnamed protein product [Kuraishia capsulata CBS 1993]
MERTGVTTENPRRSGGSNDWRCQKKCMIWSSNFGGLNSQELVSVLTQKCSPRLYSIIPNSYRITAILFVKETFDAIETFTSEGIHFMPMMLFLVGNGEKTMAYHFDEGLEWEEGWKGFAHHSLDTTYIWGRVRHLLSEKDQQFSDIMQKAWLDFGNGKEVWEPFSLSHRFM